MADISKCAGEGCNIKQHCYRYTAPHGGYYQSWVLIKPEDRINCNYFWNNKDETSKQVP